MSSRSMLPGSIKMFIKSEWGVGPAFSLKTRTDEKLAGAGWGSGVMGVLVGGSGDFAFAFLGGQVWGFDGDFSTALFQPMVFYNFPNSPVLALGYNNQISYNWKGSSGNKLTVPLATAISKTYSLKGGHGLDIGAGPYWYVVRPEGAASATLRFSINWLLP